MNMLYKMLLNTLTGGIGGIIGVNMKKDWFMAELWYNQ
jgi:hypothetical protein